MKPDVLLQPLPTQAVHSVLDGTAYSVCGEGDAVVLVHGVGMEQAVWASQLPALSRAHKVIAYDMLGHGRSRDPDESVRLADYALQLRCLLDHLQVADAVVIGHSMGALVALEFALSFPERVRKLVALNAVFMRTAHQRAAVLERAHALRQVGVAATVDAAIKRWFGDPVPLALKADALRIAGFMKRVHPLGYARSYQLFATSDAVHAHGLLKLSIPALFLTGEFDPNSTPSMSKIMAELAPQGVFDVLPNARHMMTITSAEAVNQRLLSFIALDPATATVRSIILPA